MSAAAASPKEDEQDTKEVLLQASDGEPVRVLYRLVKRFNIIKEMVEEDESDDLPVVPLALVTRSVLDDVLEFATYADGAPLYLPEKPIRENDIEKLFAKDPKLVELIKKLTTKKSDLSAFFDFVLAVNYLDDENMLDLTCAVIASFIANKTPDEIAAFFNYGPDMKGQKLQEAIDELKKLPDNAWVYGVKSSEQIAQEAAAAKLAAADAAAAAAAAAGAPPAAGAGA